MSAAPALPSYEFDEPNHIYTVCGEVWPSVTQVLEDVGIIDYRFLKGEDRERYLLRGRMVHAATELSDESDLVEESVAPEIRGYLEAWRRFRRESGFIPELIEHRGYNEQYRYAGTLDRTGKFGGCQTVEILDIKSGHSLWWVAVQLAAYSALLDSPRRFPRRAVELREDGTYRIEQFHPRDWQADFSTFLAALTVYQAKRRK